MSGNKTVKKAFLGEPDGRRKAERPKLRWLDCIEIDLKTMGFKRWRKYAEDTSVWAIVLKEALVILQGRYANKKKKKKKKKAV